MRNRRKLTVLKKWKLVTISSVPFWIGAMESYIHSAPVLGQWLLLIAFTMYIVGQTIAWWEA